MQCARALNFKCHSLVLVFFCRTRVNAPPMSGDICDPTAHAAAVAAAAEFADDVKALHMTSLGCGR